MELKMANSQKSKKQTRLEDSQFELKQKIRIKDLEKVIGYIMAIELNYLGLEYKVRYIANSEPMDRWFFPEQLEEIKR